MDESHVVTKSWKGGLEEVQHTTYNIQHYYAGIPVMKQSPVSPQHKQC